MAVKGLYDRDFFEWTQQNAELLRKGCLSEIFIFAQLLDQDYLPEQLPTQPKLSGEAPAPPRVQRRSHSRCKRSWPLVASSVMR